MCVSYSDLTLNLGNFCCLFATQPTEAQNSEFNSYQPFHIYLSLWWFARICISMIKKYKIHVNRIKLRCSFGSTYLCNRCCITQLWDSENITAGTCWVIVPERAGIFGSVSWRIQNPGDGFITRKKNEHSFLCCATVDRDKAEQRALGSAIYLVAAFVFLVLGMCMLHLVLGIDQFAISKLESQIFANWWYSMIYFLTESIIIANISLVAMVNLKFKLRSL